MLSRYQEGARPLVATTTVATPSDIRAKFVEASDAFIVIEGQPTNSDVNRVFEALSRILYPIEYNETDAVHNLIGIIQYDEPYKTKHGSSFSHPKRPKIFDETIDGSLPVTIATRKRRRRTPRYRPTGRSTTQTNTKASASSSR